MAGTKSALNTRGFGEMLRQDTQQGVQIPRIFEAERDVIELPLRRLDETTPEWWEGLTPERWAGIREKHESYVSCLISAVSDRFTGEVRNIDEAALFRCMSETLHDTLGASFTSDEQFFSQAIDTRTFNCKSAYVLSASALSLMGKDMRLFIVPDHVILAGDTFAFETTHPPDLAAFPLQELDSRYPMRQAFDAGAMLSVIFNSCACMLEQRTMFPEALSECDKALDNNPRFAYALYNKGRVFNDQNEPKEALKCFRKALSVYPEYVNALVGIGETLFNQGRSEVAIPYLAQALRIDPDSVAAQTLWSLALIEFSS